MKVISLFSGGGLGDYGLELAGMEIVAQVEIDDYCQKILKLRWPQVPKWKDIKDVKGKELPNCDMLSGGFPCQDLSQANPNGKGLNGERSGLWKEYYRLICEIRPRWVLVENVSALLIRGIGIVLADLAQAGYDTEYACIPASAVGAPHRRDRVWILAYTCDGSSGQENRGESQQKGKAQDKNRQDNDWTRKFSGTSSLDGETGKTHKDDKDKELANSDSSGLLHGQIKVKPAKDGFDAQREFKSSGDDVAYSNSLRVERSRPELQTTRTCGEGKTISHSESAGQPRCFTRQGKVELRRSYTRNRECDGGQWAIKSAMGGGVDGPPLWLVRKHIGKGISVYEQRKAIESLPKLWSEIISETLWKAIGGFDRFQKAEILFIIMRQYEKNPDETRILVEGEKTLKDFVRGLWLSKKITSASSESKNTGQRPIEHTNTLQELSRLLAHNLQKDWSEPGWEDEVPRVINGITDRVDRLKLLGNGQVVQVVQWIGERIIEYEKNQ